MMIVSNEATSRDLDSLLTLTCTFSFVELINSNKAFVLASEPLGIFNNQDDGLGKRWGESKLPNDCSLIDLRCLVMLSEPFLGKTKRPRPWFVDAATGWPSLTSVILGISFSMVQASMSYITFFSFS
jgi:hypothetical protein